MSEGLRGQHSWHGSSIGQVPLACLQSAAPLYIAAVGSRCVDHAYIKIADSHIYISFISSGHWGVGHTLTPSLGVFSRLDPQQSFPC